MTKFAAIFGRKLIYDLEEAFDHFAIVVKENNNNNNNDDDNNIYEEYQEVEDMDLKRILRNRKKLLLRNVLEAFALMGRGLSLSVFQSWYD
jgi:hypothetical protein